LKITVVPVKLMQIIKVFGF